MCMSSFMLLSMPENSPFAYPLTRMVSYLMLSSYTDRLAVRMLRCENWSYLMQSTIVFADDIGSQLSHWIFSTVFLQFLVTFLFAFLFPITSAAIINYLERKVMAWMQDRKGPLHVGPHGSLQLLADIGKLLTKEDVHPAQTDKMVFLLAPSAFIAPMIASFAVLPFSPFIGLPGTALATGIVYLVAMSSLDVIGVIMAGGGSNNKYALIGCLRAAPPIISYQLPLVLALVGVG